MSPGNIHSSIHCDRVSWYTFYGRSLCGSADVIKRAAVNLKAVRRTHRQIDRYVYLYSVYKFNGVTKRIRCQIDKISEDRSRRTVPVAGVREEDHVRAPRN